MPKVSIQEGPGSGTEYELEQAAILGRLDTNDIPVRDSKASREHAKIYRQGQRYAIVDLNSVNGTFVNGTKITKQVLEPGDEILIGTVRLLFEDPEAEDRKRAAVTRRKSLDDDYGARSGDTPQASGGAPELVMKSHKPLQYSRVKPGQPLLGFDFDQLSDAGRMIVYLLLLGFFSLLIYVCYAISRA